MVENWALARESEQEGRRKNKKEKNYKKLSKKRAKIMQVSFHKLCAQFSSSHSLCNRKMARERERANGDGYCCLSMHTFFNDVVMVIVVVWSHYVYRLLLFGTNLPRSCNNNNNNIYAWYALPELSWAELCTYIEACVYQFCIVHCIYAPIDCCVVSAYQRSQCQSAETA